MHRFSNNAVSTLAAGIDTSAAEITVASGTAGLFNTRYVEEPADGSFQAVTLTRDSMPGEYEVVHLTACSGDTFAVVRGVEGSAGAQAWPAGTKVSARVTAGMLGKFVQKPEAVGGAIVMSGGGYPLVLSDGYDKAGATGAANFVARGVSRVNHSWVIGGYSVLQHAQVYGADESSPCMATETAGGTCPVDLGVPKTWDSGEHKRWHVVCPTTPDGYQYWPDIADVEADYLQAMSEPAFLGEGYPLDVAGGSWRPTAMPVDFTHEFAFARLVVTEVGFICNKTTASTVPSVSIGVPGNATRFANNVALTQITASGDVHRISISAGGTPAPALTFRVDASPTDGSFLGRFYFKGFFTEPTY